MIKLSKKRVDERLYDVKHLLLLCLWASQFTFKDAKNQIWFSENAGLSLYNDRQHTLKIRTARLVTG